MEGASRCIHLNTSRHKQALHLNPCVSLPMLKPSFLQGIALLVRDQGLGGLNHFGKP
jgi:hypothetical protein